MARRSGAPEDPAHRPRFSFRHVMQPDTGRFAAVSLKTSVARQAWRRAHKARRHAGEGFADARRAPTAPKSGSAGVRFAARRLLLFEKQNTVIIMASPSGTPNDCDIPLIESMD